MANRTLVQYYEQRDGEQTGFDIEIQRSAAGQPGILVTITNQLEEQSTIVVPDALALFAPVLEWLLHDHQLTEDVARHSNNRFVEGLYDRWNEDHKHRLKQAAAEHLQSLVALGLTRRDADTFGPERGE